MDTNLYVEAVDVKTSKLNKNKKSVIKTSSKHFYCRNQFSVSILYCCICQGIIHLLFSHQQIMKDKWINAGYEGDELKPHAEPVEDLNDIDRIGKKDSPFYYKFIWLITDHKRTN